ncbi:hypothetical protein [Streptomyces sp. NPDC001815]|uniref:hypothetical protein n=1 Tax=Streptomyces sp. NPDC001815 TaxID=3154526 RepID=UPI00332707C9
MRTGRRDDARVLADAFAPSVLRRETEQLRQLIHHSPAMDVGFRPLAVPGQGSSDPETMPSAGIADFYRRTQDARLVVVGGSGTGKTVLLIRMALGLLDLRQPGEAVPYRLSAAGWDVGEGLDRWMTRELARDSGLSFGQAALLVSEGMILPVLDGLDEMDPSDAEHPCRAAAAWRALHERTREGKLAPFVTACRDSVHQLLAASDGHLATPAVVMSALNTERIRQCVDGLPGHERWHEVLGELERRPCGRLARQLSVPWHLAVVTALYEERDDDGGHLRDPSDLIRTQSALTDAGPVSMYAASLLRAGGLDESEARRIRSMLSELAAYLVDNQALQRRAGGDPLPHVDIVVHRLWPITGSRSARWLSAALSMVLWTPAAFVVWWVLGRMDWPSALDAGIAVAASLLPLRSLWSSLAWWPHPKRIVLGRLRTRAGRARLAMALPGALALGAVLAATGRPDYTVAFAISFAVVFGAGIALAVRDTADSRLLVLTGTATGLLLGLLGRVLVGFLGAAGGLLFGTAGAGLALFAAVAAALRLPEATPEYVRNPVFGEFVSNDLRTGLVSGTLTAAITAAMLALLPGLGASLLQIAVAAGGVGLSVGLGAVADTWRRHVAMLLLARGRLPVRLGAALERSYRSGLLRRAGIAYQFRHLELRDHFAHGALR